MYKLFISACNCGAITISQEDDPDSVSMSRETFDKEMPNVKIENEGEEHINCNHCVNHWGVDLCVCGSGEKPEECQETFARCGNPYQDIEAVKFWLVS